MTNKMEKLQEQIFFTEKVNSSPWVRGISRIVKHD